MVVKSGGLGHDKWRNMPVNKLLLLLCYPSLSLAKCQALLGDDVDLEPQRARLRVRVAVQ